MTRLICSVLTGLLIILSMVMIFIGRTEDSKILSVNLEIEQLTEEIDTLRTETAKVEAELADLKDTYIFLYNETYYLLNKVAFLSFDDGPSSNTTAILDILAVNGIKATFFVVGSQLDTATNKAILRRIAEEGHSIGLHTNSHVYKEVYASVDAYFEDLYAIQAKVEEICGVKSYVVRMPGGMATAKYYLGSEKVQEIKNRLWAEGFVIDDWNVDSGDASAALVPEEEIAQNVLNGVNKRLNGSYKYPCALILMHDAPAKKTTPKALQSIIDSIRALEMSFEPLTVDSYSYRQIE